MHMIDERTPRDMLAQLAMLRGPQDVVVSVGHPREHAGVKVNSIVHLPMGSRLLGGWRMQDVATAAAVVHAWSADALVAAQVVARNRNLPLVYSLAGCPSAESQLRAVVDLACRGILAVAVPTKASQEALRLAGATREAVFVLPPPVAAPEDLPRRRAAVRRELGVPDDDVLMTCPDEMTRLGGHKFSAWAHAVLRQILPNVRLLLPGDGPAWGTCRFFVNSTGYDDEIYLTGHRYSMHDCLAAADMAMVLHEDTCGVVAALSALAVGLPIAAAATPDLKEVLGDDAVYAVPGDPKTISAAALKIIDGGCVRRPGRLDAEHSPQAARKRVEEIYAGAEQKVV